MPRVPPLTPEAFAEAIGRGDGVLLDTRDMLAFGGGHVAGALNIGGRPELSVWAGCCWIPTGPIYLVLEDDRRLSEVTALLWRTGFVDFGGYLAGGVGGLAGRGARPRPDPAD